jgi:hypothetical protein
MNVFTGFTLKDGEPHYLLLLLLFMMPGCNLYVRKMRMNQFQDHYNAYIGYITKGADAFFHLF